MELINLLLILILPFLLAPIYDSIERKIKAAIQNRIGPLGFTRSFLQSWFDIIKLFSKELVLPGYGFAMITLLEFLLITFTLIFLQTSIMFSSLTITKVLFLVFLSISTAFFIVRSISLDNPFASIGVFREFYIMLSTESFFIPILALMFFYEGSPLSEIFMFIVIALSCYVLSGRVPFDIAEAEPEIASGVNIELSGPLLGVAVYSLYIKRYILAEVLSYVILKLFNIGLESYILLLFISILTFIIWMITGIISYMLARTRVDIGPATMLKIMITLTLLTILTNIFRVM